MGLRFNVPLPGPFSYSARLSPRRRSDTSLSGVALIALVAVPLLAAAALVFGAVCLIAAVVVAVAVGVFRLIVYLTDPSSRPAAVAARAELAAQPELTLEVAEFRARDAEHNGLPQSAAAWRQAGGLPPKVELDPVQPAPPSPQVTAGRDVSRGMFDSARRRRD